MLIAGGTIVAVVIAATLVVVLINRHTTATTTGASHTPAPASNGGITSEDQLLEAIRTQGWTPLRAEQLFALDVGPLPGVSVKGISATGEFDASMAVTGLYGQWDHLTAAQRTAATRYLTGSDAQTQRSTTPTHGADAELLGNTNTPAFDYQKLADAANHDEALYTHTSTVELTVDVSYDPPPNPTTYAATWLFVRNGTGPWTPQPQGCTARVLTRSLSGSTLSARRRSWPTRSSTVSYTGRRERGRTGRRSVRGFRRASRTG